MNPHTLFLTNPLSGRKKRASEILKRVDKTYAEQREQVWVREIDFGQLDQILEEAIEAGVQNIYAVGGDGTVNAIGAKLINRPVNFGVIPTGSGNGYARNIGFSIKTSLAVRQTIDAKAIQVDTATFNQKPFLNIAGIGLGAEVAHEYTTTKTRGFGPYLKSSARSIFSHKPEAYRLTIDGKIMDLEDVLGIEVAIGTQYGYQAKAAPLASITDGLLDIVVIKSFPMIKAASIVSKLFRGQVNRSKHIDFYQGKSVRIERDQPGKAQMDGEPFDAPSLIDIHIKEHSLNLVLPNTLTGEKIASL
jgi:YegS/Rv2252/BmrU family lipid kinase